MMIGKKKKKIGYKKEYERNKRGSLPWLKH